MFSAPSRLTFVSTMIIIFIKLVVILYSSLLVAVVYSSSSSSSLFLISPSVISENANSPLIRISSSSPMTSSWPSSAIVLDRTNNRHRICEKEEYSSSSFLCRLSSSNSWINVINETRYGSRSFVQNDDKKLSSLLRVHAPLVDIACTESPSTTTIEKYLKVPAEASSAMIKILCTSTTALKVSIDDQVVCESAHGKRLVDNSINSNNNNNAQQSTSSDALSTLATSGATPSISSAIQVSSSSVVMKIKIEIENQPSPSAFWGVGLITNNDNNIGASLSSKYFYTVSIDKAGQPFAISAKLGSLWSEQYRVEAISVNDVCPESIISSSSSSSDLMRNIIINQQLIVSNVSACQWMIEFELQISTLSSSTTNNDDIFSVSSQIASVQRLFTAESEHLQYPIPSSSYLFDDVSQNGFSLAITSTDDNHQQVTFSPFQIITSSTSLPSLSPSIINAPRTLTPGTIFNIQGSNLFVSSDRERHRDHFRLVSLSSSSSNDRNRKNYDLTLIRSNPTGVDIVFSVPQSIVAGVYYVEVCVDSHGCTSSRDVHVVVPLVLSGIRETSVSWLSSSFDEENVLTVTGQNFPPLLSSSLNQNESNNKIELNIVTSQKSFTLTAIRNNRGTRDTLFFPLSASVQEPSFFTENVTSFSIKYSGQFDDDSTVVTVTPALQSQLSSYDASSRSFSIASAPKIFSYDITFFSAQTAIISSISPLSIDVSELRDSMGILVNISGSGFSSSTGVIFEKSNFANSINIMKCHEQYFIESANIIQCKIHHNNNTDSEQIGVFTVKIRQSSTVGLFFDPANAVTFEITNNNNNNGQASSTIENVQSSFRVSEVSISPTSGDFDENNNNNNNNNKKNNSSDRILISGFFPNVETSLDRIEIMRRQDQTVIPCSSVNMTSSLFLIECLTSEELTFGNYEVYVFKTTTTNTTGTSTTASASFSVPMQLSPSPVSPSRGSLGGYQQITISGRRFPTWIISGNSSSGGNSILQVLFGFNGNAESDDSATNECFDTQVINSTTLTCFTHPVVVASSTNQLLQVKSLSLLFRETTTIGTTSSSSSLCNTDQQEDRPSTVITFRTTTPDNNNNNNEQTSPIFTFDPSSSPVLSRATILSADLNDNNMTVLLEFTSNSLLNFNLSQDLEEVLLVDDERLMISSPEFIQLTNFTFISDTQVSAALFPSSTNSQLAMKQPKIVARFNSIGAAQDLTAATTSSITALASTSSRIDLSNPNNLAFFSIEIAQIGIIGNNNNNNVGLAGGEIITLSGTRISSPQMSVFVCGRPCTNVSVVNDSAIQCIAPSHPLLYLNAVSPNQNRENYKFLSSPIESTEEVLRFHSVGEGIFTISNNNKISTITTMMNTSPKSCFFLKSLTFENIGTLRNTTISVLTNRNSGGNSSIFAWEEVLSVASLETSSSRSNRIDFSKPIFGCSSLKLTTSESSVFALYQRLSIIGQGTTWTATTAAQEFASFTSSSPSLKCPVEVVSQVSGRSNCIAANGNETIPCVLSSQNYDHMISYSASSSDNVIVSKIDPPLLNTSPFLSSRSLAIFGSGFGDNISRVEVKIVSTSSSSSSSSSTLINCEVTFAQFSVLECQFPTSLVSFSSSSSSQTDMIMMMNLEVVVDGTHRAVIEHSTSRLLTGNLNLPEHSIFFVGEDFSEYIRQVSNNNITTSTTLVIPKGQTLILDKSPLLTFASIVIDGGKLLVLSSSSSLSSSNQEQQSPTVSLFVEDSIIIKNGGQLIIGTEEQPMHHRRSLKFELNFMNKKNNSITPTISVSSGGVLSMIATNDDQSSLTNSGGSILYQTRFFNFPSSLSAAACNTTAYLAEDALIGATRFVISGVWNWNPGKRLLLGNLENDPKFSSNLLNTENGKWCKRNKYESVRIALRSSNATHTILSLTTPLQCNHFIARGSSSLGCASMGPPVFEEFIEESSSSFADDLNRKLVINGGRIEVDETAEAFQAMNVRFINGNEIHVAGRRTQQPFVSEEKEHRCVVKIQRCKFVKSSLQIVPSMQFVFVWGNLFLSSTIDFTMINQYSEPKIASFSSFSSDEATALFAIQCNAVLHSPSPLSVNLIHNLQPKKLDLRILNNFVFGSTGESGLMINASSLESVSSLAFKGNAAFGNDGNGLSLFTPRTTATATTLPLVIESFRARKNGKIGINIAGGGSDDDHEKKQQQQKIQISSSQLGTSGIDLSSASTSSILIVRNTIFVAEGGSSTGGEYCKSLDPIDHNNERFFGIRIQQQYATDLVAAVTSCSFIDFSTLHDKKFAIVLPAARSIISSSSSSSPMLITTSALSFLTTSTTPIPIQMSTRLLFYDQHQSSLSSSFPSTTPLFPTIIDEDESLFEGTSTSNFIATSPLTMITRNTSLSVTTLFGFAQSSSCLSEYSSGTLQPIVGLMQDERIHLQNNFFTVCGGDLSFLPMELSFTTLLLLTSDWKGTDATTQLISTSSKDSTVPVALPSSSFTSFPGQPLRSKITFQMPVGINTRQSDLGREFASQNQNVTIHFSTNSQGVINYSSFELKSLFLRTEQIEALSTSEPSIRLGIQVPVSSSIVQVSSSSSSAASIIITEEFGQSLYQSSLASSPASLPYSLVSFDQSAPSTTTLAMSSFTFPDGTIDDDDTTTVIINKIAFAPSENSCNSTSSSSSSLTSPTTYFTIPSEHFLRPRISPSIQVSDWNDPAAWPHYNNQVPTPDQENVDVVIPRGVTITLSLDAPSSPASVSKRIGYYRSIIVEGSLLIVNGSASGNDVTIAFETSFFIVLGGTLSVTNLNTDGKKKVQFLLHQQRSTSHLCFSGPVSSSSDTTTTTKFKPGTFASFGVTNFQGSTPSTIISQLRTTVSPSTPTRSASSINLQDDITGWRNQDEIVISSTSFNPNEAEIVTVDTTAVDPETNQAIPTPNVDGSFVTATRIQHEHFSLDQFASGKSLSANVGLLTRNIEIKAASASAASSRCFIVFSSISRGGNLFSATGTISGVRFDNCGSADSPSSSSSPAIHIHQTHLDLSFNRVVVTNSRGKNTIGITSSTSTLLIQESIIAFSTTQGSSLRIDSQSDNIRIEDNLVLGTRESDSSSSRSNNNNNNQDDLVCSYLQEPGDYNTNTSVIFLRNIAAGSESIGFCFPAPTAFTTDECYYNQDERRLLNLSTTTQAVNDGNIAHSNVVGLLIFDASSSSLSACTEITRPTAWHNSYAGILVLLSDSSSSSSSQRLSSQRLLLLINQPQINNNLYGIEAHHLSSQSSSSSSSSSAVKILRGQISGRSARLASEKLCEGYFQNVIRRVNGKIIQTLPLSTISSALNVGSDFHHVAVSSSSSSGDRFNELWTRSNFILRVLPHFIARGTSSSSSSSSSSATITYRKPPTIFLENCVFSDYALIFDSAVAENQLCSRSRIISAITTSNTNALSVQLTNSSVVYSAVFSLLTTTTTTSVPSSINTLLPGSANTTTTSTTDSSSVEDRKNVLVYFSNQNRASSSMILDRDGTFFGCTTTTTTTIASTTSSSSSSSSCVAMSTLPQLSPSAWEVSSPSSQSCVRYELWSDDLAIINNNINRGGLLCSGSSTQFARLNVDLVKNGENNDNAESHQEDSGSIIWIRSDQARRTVGSMSYSSLKRSSFTISRGQSYTMEFRNEELMKNFLPKYPVSLSFSDCGNETTTTTTLINLALPPSLSSSFVTSLSLWIQTVNTSSQQTICLRELTRRQSSNMVQIPLSSSCYEKVYFYVRPFATVDDEARIFSNDNSLIDIESQIGNIQNQIAQRLSSTFSGDSATIIQSISLPIIVSSSLSLGGGNKNRQPLLFPFSISTGPTFSYRSSTGFSVGFVVGITIAILAVIIFVIYVASLLYKEIIHVGTIEEYQVKTLAEIALQAQKEKEEASSSRSESAREGRISPNNNNDNNSDPHKFVIYDNDGNVIDEDDFLAMFDEDNVLGGNPSGDDGFDDNDDYYTTTNRNQGRDGNNRNNFLGDSQFGVFSEVNDSMYGSVSNQHHNSNRQSARYTTGGGGLGGARRLSLTRKRQNNVAAPSAAGLGTIRPMVFDAFNEMVHEEEEIIDEEHQRRMRERDRLRGSAMMDPNNTSSNFNNFGFNNMSSYNNNNTNNQSSNNNVFNSGGAPFTMMNQNNNGSYYHQQQHPQSSGLLTSASGSSRQPSARIFGANNANSRYSFSRPQSASLANMISMNNLSNTAVTNQQQQQGNSNANNNTRK